MDLRHMADDELENRRCRERIVDVPHSGWVDELDDDHPRLLIN
jgi:hypothetical protein